MSPRCPKCSTVFTAHPTSLPIILPSCLHHLCSSCVTSSTQSQAGAVQCGDPMCQVVLTRGDVHHLLPDRHLLGSLEIKHKKMNLKQERMSDDLTQFIPPLSQVANTPMLCVKCRDISELICTSCKTAFCSSNCFSLLHKTQALATHQSQPYKYLPFAECVCKEHGKNIEFVAVEDLRTGCSFCAVVGELKGRNVVELSLARLSFISINYQVAGLGDFLLSHRGWFNSSALKLLICQVSCLVLNVAQMYAMDLVLGNEFLSLGNNFLSLELINQALTKVFPKVVKCSMIYVGPSSDPVSNSGMCTLPINIINEKIYLVIWVWFMVITCVSIISLLHQGCLLLLPSLRQMQLQRKSCMTPGHLVRSVTNQCMYGDTVLLQLIATNTDSAQFTALLTYLSDKPALPQHQPSFMHESFHGGVNALLAGKGGRKEV